MSRLANAGGGGGGGLAIVASTPANSPGVPLINGTQTILEWIAPNDGKLHIALIACELIVTATMTGGECGFHWTGYNGYEHFWNDFANDVGPQQYYIGTDSNGPIGFFSVQPGGNVIISQDTALTGGAASVIASIAAL